MANKDDETLKQIISGAIIGGVLGGSGGAVLGGILAPAIIDLFKKRR